MTYCVGMLLDAGLVLLADSRTNAGVDQISTFRKVTVFERPGERVMVLLSAGNLAISQAVSRWLRECCEAGGASSLYRVPSMSAAVDQVREALREVHRRDGSALQEHKIEFNAS